MPQRNIYQVLLLCSDRPVRLYRIAIDKVRDDNTPLRIEDSKLMHPKIV